MIILGIDPGYERLGWGVIEKNTSISYISCGVIRTSPKDDSAHRLSSAFAQLEKVLEEYQPNQSVVEGLFFSNNQKTVIQVAQAKGMILTCLANADIPVTEYTPLQIKAVVAGHGQADKKAVEKMVRLQLPNVPSDLLDDTLDALAVALTYACQSHYE